MQRLRSLFARVAVEELHVSGDSDNRGSNCNLNLLIAATALEICLDIHPSDLFWVEGDDLLIVHRRLPSSTHALNPDVLISSWLCPGETT